ncbi:unnamed protein product [Echinostoma caproni]|uniref:FAD-binding PCMH-type domain-containing protein n=1 Tax=Echinostoma caproni TaxID=27848 RepID=A0A183AJS4_9TREM|nr:unnamed protein product [Echinostoma caproni]
MRQTYSAAPNTTFSGLDLLVADSRPSRNADFTLMEFAMRTCEELSIDSGGSTTKMHWSLDDICGRLAAVPFIWGEGPAATGVFTVRGPLGSPVLWKILRILRQVAGEDVDIGTESPDCGWIVWAAYYVSSQDLGCK